jgi:hypothetical protein
LHPPSPSIDIDIAAPDVEAGIAEELVDIVIPIVADEVEAVIAISVLENLCWKNGGTRSIRMVSWCNWS